MNSTWNKYYVSNVEALAMIRAYKEAPTIKKRRRIKGVILKRLDYLVYAKIKGYKNKTHYEDFLQEGRLGLMKAVEDFDFSKGINFFKYARWHIQSRITCFMKRCKTEKTKKIKLMMKNDQDEEHIVGPDNQYEILEGLAIVRKAMDNLTNMDRCVLKMRFGMDGSDEYTLRQIGEAFSLTKQRIEQIEKKAILKLKKNEQVQEFFCELL